MEPCEGSSSSAEENESINAYETPFSSAVQDSHNFNEVRNDSGYLTTPDSSLGKMQDMFLTDSSEKLSRIHRSFTNHSGTTEDISELKLPSPEILRKPAIPFTSPSSQELQFMSSPRLAPSLSTGKSSPLFYHQTLFTPTSTTKLNKIKYMKSETSTSSVGSGPPIQPSHFSTPLGKGVKRARRRSESDSSLDSCCCSQSPTVSGVQVRHRLKWRDTVNSSLLQNNPLQSPQLDSEPPVPVSFSTPKDICDLTAKDGQQELLCRSGVGYKAPFFLKNSCLESSDSFESAIGSSSADCDSCIYDRDNSVNYEKVSSKPSMSTVVCNSSCLGCTRATKAFIDGQEQVDIVLYLSEISDHRCVVSKIFKYLSPQDLSSFARVSHVWRKTLLKDPSAKRRWRGYKDQLEKDKENFGMAHKDKKTLGELEENAGAQWQRYALLQINNQSTPENSTNQHNTTDGSNVNLSSNSLRFQEFVKEGQRLGPGECLRSCPRCSSPSQVVLRGGHGRCTRSVCGFEFCTRCLCESGNQHVCRTPQSSRLSSSLSSVGSNKSKRNLRRL